MALQMRNRGQLSRVYEQVQRKTQGKCKNNYSNIAKCLFNGLEQDLSQVGILTFDPAVGCVCVSSSSL